MCSMVRTGFGPSGCGMGVLEATSCERSNASCSASTSITRGSRRFGGGSGCTDLVFTPDSSDSSPVTEPWEAAMMSRRLLVRRLKSRFPFFSEPSRFRLESDFDFCFGAGPAFFSSIACIIRSSSASESERFSPPAPALAFAWGSPCALGMKSVTTSSAIKRTPCLRLLRWNIPSNG